MIENRHYQQEASSAVEAHLLGGAGSVLVVSPAGSGKTTIGGLLSRKRRTLWAAHRHELVDQAVERLRLVTGKSIARLLPGDPEPSADCHAVVSTIQTLGARRAVGGNYEQIILDEAHHYVAEEWRAIQSRLGDGIPRIGFTAYPERSDGVPLSDLFGHLVVAAQPSDLLRGGHILPYRVIAPERDLGNDIATDPLKAYRRFGEGERAFIYVNDVVDADLTSQKFFREGVDSCSITWSTPDREREGNLRRFVRGDIRALVNVYTMTEGVDVPAARVVILCRRCEHVQTFLQASCRAGRPAPNKPDGILIDLTGATHRHGHPNEDRDYEAAFHGRPVRKSGTSVEREPAGRGQQIIKHTQLYLYDRGALPEGVSYPLPTREFKPRRHADRLRSRLSKITQRSGSDIASSIGAAMGGLGE